MRKFVSYWVPVLLLSYSVLALPATDNQGSGAPPVSMDARFSRFDTIAHIRRNHRSLAPQAESISHWSAYYNVNPVLLVNIAKASSSQRELTSASIRDLAESLGKLARRQARTSHPELTSEQALAGELGSIYSLAPEDAAGLIAKTRSETAAAGIVHSLQAATEVPPALDLPFTQPQAWEFNGVHTWTGNDDGSPMSSLDFARQFSSAWGEGTSDDWVTAASDGEVTVYSSCYVQILHDSGWASRYYHLDNLQVTTGQRVQAGDRLANYADDLTQALCSGGHSSGPHLHFALLKDGQYFSLQDIALSGYLVHPGDSSYDSSSARMWLEKRDVRYFAQQAPISQEEGDNTIDYRYNGMWFSPDHNGHGLNFEITESPQEGGSRKTIFIVMYTYDDDGLANFYVGNRDFERWRSDESMVVDMIQTAGGDFSSLQPVDFDDPEDVKPAGQIEVRFFDCTNAQTEIDLDERSSGQSVDWTLDLVKIIGVPDHVCDAASLPLED
jgi:murein DD-endopeptidase MepM/ murein hydrolase activator NlpD